MTIFDLEYAMLLASFRCRESIKNNDRQPQIKLEAIWAAHFGRVYLARYAAAARRGTR